MVCCWVDWGLVVQDWLSWDSFCLHLDVSHLQQTLAWSCTHGSGRVLKYMVTCKASGDVGLETAHRHSYHILFTRPGQVYRWENNLYLLRGRAENHIEKGTDTESSEDCDHFCKVPCLPLARKIDCRSTLEKLILIEGSNLANIAFK